MLNFTRLGIIVTERCNSSCLYCYRINRNKDKRIFLTDKFIDYIKNLDNQITKNICLLGGEPLISNDSINIVKTLIKNISSDIPKKVTTNGLYLTEELIKFFNDTNTTVHISHDGRNTKFSRGYDIFENEILLKLIKQIKYLQVYYTVNKLTYTNESISDYIANILERDDFTPLVGMDIYSKYNLLEYCIQNHIVFMEKYQKNSIRLKNDFIREKRKYPIRVNLTPSGDIWSINGEIYFGNIDQTQDEFDYKIEHIPYADYDYCKNNVKCKIRNKCEWTLLSNPLFCRYQHMLISTNPTIIYI